MRFSKHFLPFSHLAYIVLVYHVTLHYIALTRTDARLQNSHRRAGNQSQTKQESNICMSIHEAGQASTKRQSFIHSPLSRQHAMLCTGDQQIANSKQRLLQNASCTIPQYQGATSPRNTQKRTNSIWKVGRTKASKRYTFSQPSLLVSQSLVHQTASSP